MSKQSRERRLDRHSVLLETRERELDNEIKDALGTEKNINQRLDYIIKKNRIVRFITVIYYRDWYTPVLIQWNFKFKVYEVDTYFYAHDVLRMSRTRAIINAREWANGEGYPYLKGED